MTEPWPEYEPAGPTLAYRCRQCETALTGTPQPDGSVAVEHCPTCSKPADVIADWRARGE